MVRTRAFQACNRGSTPRGVTRNIALATRRFFFLGVGGEWEDGQTHRQVVEWRYMNISHTMVTTAFELPGHRTVQSLGVARGIIVRSRSIVGNIGVALQSIVGGNITLLTNLCERTRSEALELMLAHAAEMGANAVVGVRYDATEVMSGITEVLVYGTAVVVEPQS